MSEAFLKRLTLRFSGGCELLFGQQTEIVVESTIPAGTTLGDLVPLIKERYVQERPELFVDTNGTSIRPGILVLVNDCDAEVFGGVNYVIEDGDVVEFISTLHGG